MGLFPAKHNFRIWSGATFRHQITVYEDAEGTDPRVLTNYTALLEIRAKPKDPTPIFTLSTTNGRITVDGANGTLTLFISASDTAALSWTSGVYDLTITAPSAGDTDALLFGSFSVTGI